MRGDGQTSNVCMHKRDFSYYICNSIQCILACYRLYEGKPCFFFLSCVGKHFSFYYKKKKCFEINLRVLGGLGFFFLYIIYTFFFNITKMNYIGEKIGQTEGDKHMHIRTHAHTHFQIKIQAIKWPSKHSLFLYWFTQK